MTTPRKSQPKAKARRLTCKSCFGSGRIEDENDAPGDRRCDDCVGRGYYYAKPKAKALTKAVRKGATPRVDAFHQKRHTDCETWAGYYSKAIAFARQLELELSATKAERDGLHTLHNKNAAHRQELLELCASQRAELSTIKSNGDELAEALDGFLGDGQIEQEIADARKALAYYRTGKEADCAAMSKDVS